MAIGNKLVLGSKTFRSGLVSSLDFGKKTIGRTAEKINLEQKRIKLERKQQRDLDQRISETEDRKEKEKLIESKKKSAPAFSVVKNVLTKPINALFRIIAAWTIANLPKIIQEVLKFTKKVRIVVAAIKNAVKGVGTMFQGVARVTSAFIKNLQEFDFNDRSGRIKEAQTELNDGMDEISTNFNEISNVWGRSEAELDTILNELESGSTMKEATDAIMNASVGGATPTEPQQSVVGTNSSSSGGKWGPILDLIAKAESVDGSYDSIYPNSTKPGLSDMTVREADAWQKSTTAKRGSAAAGRYQFMDIARQAKQAGVDMDDKFSPQNQDKMAIYLIEKKRGVDMDMLDNNPLEAAERLSMEWAGLPVLKTTKGAKRTVTAGQSFYAGDGRNASNVKTGDVTSAFQAATQEPSEVKQPPQPSTGKNTSQLTDKVAFKDFSRTTSQGGTGAVGKTSGYNENRGHRLHKGIDIGTSGQTGWYVGLKLDGTVTYVGAPDGLSSGAGKMVIIKDSRSREYVFMHLNNFKVTNGQKYKAGSPIGEIGNTGTSTNIHLHFEVRINNQHIDPGPYLKYLDIGKYKVTASSSSTNTVGTSEEKATEVATAASSKRTTGNRTTQKTTLLRQQIYVVPQVA